jgi:hypothetical protein
MHRNGEASLRARIASYSRWAGTGDRTAATAPARAAFESRFEREVDPEGVLPAEERVLRAASARRAYFTRLAYLSVKARRK